jgi:hypothetical protein
MTQDRGRMTDYTGRIDNAEWDERAERESAELARAERESTYDAGDENKSSEEIKADIEQTRQEMSEKINQIQERLDPQRLKEHAQETVRSVVTDTSNSIMSYLQTDSAHMGLAAIEIMRRNPIPSALVGLGLGWLLVEALSSSNEPGAVERTRYQDRYGAFDQPSYANDYNYRSGATAYPATAASGAYTAYASGYVAPVEEEDEQSARGRVSEVLHSAQESAAGVVEQVKDKAAELGHQVQEKAEQTGDYVRDKVSQLTGHSRSEAAQSYYGNQYQPQYSRQGQRRYRSRSRVNRMGRTLQRNPVPFGLAALAVGTLLGLSLPATQTESRVMGDTRDRLFDNAQNLAHDVQQRAKDAVQEAASDLKQTTQQTVDNLKQTSKEAVDNL